MPTFEFQVKTTQQAWKKIDAFKELFGSEPRVCLFGHVVSKDGNPVFLDGVMADRVGTHWIEIPIDDKAMWVEIDHNPVIVTLGEK